MEMHSTIASWEAAERLTLYEATQHVLGVKSNTRRRRSGYPRENRSASSRPFVRRCDLGARDRPGRMSPLGGNRGAEVGRAVKLVRHAQADVF